MFVYRACSSHYSKDLSGRGAADKGGRWNPKGFSVVYSSENSSLCILESLVNLGRIIPENYVILKIKIPEDILIQKIDSLPKDWATSESACHRVGSKWLELKQTTILQVPSVVNPNEFNFLINPTVAGGDKIKIVEMLDFPRDARLFL